jgi:purine-binding chemotaxis protein CheW
VATQPLPVTDAPVAPPVARRSSADKHLIFSLGSEEFGIQVLAIKEIIGMQEITAIPKMPRHVKGVINLRGQVIPVIDLSLKFSLVPQEYTYRTCIIVVRSQGASGSDRLMGAIADGVSEVLTIAEEDIESSPDFGGANSVPYLQGMAKVNGKVKMLLDIHQVFQTADAVTKLGLSS